MKTDTDDTVRVTLTIRRESNPEWYALLKNVKSGRARAEIVRGHLTAPRLGQGARPEAPAPSLDASKTFAIINNNGYEAVLESVSKTTVNRSSFVETSEKATAALDSPPERNESAAEKDVQDAANVPNRLNDRGGLAATFIAGGVNGVKN
jgi:hypothetical protein